MTPDYTIKPMISVDEIAARVAALFKEGLPKAPTWQPYRYLLDIDPAEVEVHAHQPIAMIQKDAAAGEEEVARQRHFAVGHRQHRGAGHGRIVGA